MSSGILKITTERRIKFYEEQRSIALAAKQFNLAQFYKNKIMDATNKLKYHPKYLSINSPCSCKECKLI